MRKKLPALVIVMLLLLAAEEMVLGFGSFALFSPSVKAEEPLKTKDHALMKVIRSAEPEANGGEVSALPEGMDANGEYVFLPLELNIGNRNPLRQMRNVRAGILPEGSGEDVRYAGEAVRIDIPRSEQGRYNFVLTLQRERYEKLLSGEGEAIVRVEWEHGLHKDVKLGDLLNKASGGE
ncbi:type 1 periplasmic-binding domain-containing protein [Saccharibacillus alkalitolerans]|uniref:Uncharacterized protein n=1 Tax=Saccharibacillus alkalitolerans TaxID=2705290 RepID=A0ABX0FAQ1_9BACL|nr:hypothetical protein [Saccharibacillus alkalitolerans]NGZ77480.1 hypothetical protein [Saccharibacillus alkalitolerans]